MNALPKSAEHVLRSFAPQETAAGARPRKSRRHGVQNRQQDIALLIAADLLVRKADGALTLTGAGRAHLARAKAARGSGAIDPFRAQHLALAERAHETGLVTVDDSESPLAWLARRNGRDGRPLVEAVQFQAGERLRAEFTRSQLMPHTTANWGVTIAKDRSAGPPATFTETVIAARQRVRAALDAVGPEFAGLLLDVCCFLKGLADIERDRGWPPRSAKVVVQLGLDRLARHYGLSAEARGRAAAPLRTWLAPGAAFTLGE